MVSFIFVVYKSKGVLILCPMLNLRVIELLLALQFREIVIMRLENDFSSTTAS